MDIKRRREVDGRSTIKLEGLYCDDVNAFIKLLATSEIPQFVAMAAKLKEEMREVYTVEVQRNHPYTESLWYEYQDLEEAKKDAKETARLFGVQQVVVWNEKDEVVATYCGGEDDA